MLDAMTALRRLAAHLRTGSPLPTPDRNFLADALDRHLVDGEELERALGLRGAAGQRTARTQAALAERDRLLCEAAAEHFAGLTATEAARLMRTRWARYAAVGWLRERALPQAPGQRAGTLEGALWAVMKVRDHVLGERALRAILREGASEPVAVSYPYSLPRLRSTLADVDEED